MSSISEEAWALVEKLQADKLFNTRGNTMYRDEYLPTRGAGNFYDTITRDLASEDQATYQTALSALNQKLADGARLGEAQ